MPDHIIANAACLTLLLPSTLMWLAVLIEARSGRDRLLRAMLGWAPDLALMLFALVFPFAAASLGLWSWNHAEALTGLVVAAAAGLLLLLVPISALTAGRG